MALKPAMMATRTTRTLAEITVKKLVVAMGVLGPGEGCDDGNEDPTDECAGCQPASCGDGVVQSGERRDDGNALDTDECLSNCAPAACGDGVVWADREACDDGNADSGDACTGRCPRPLWRWYFTPRSAGG